jgi:hypothetical protein
MGLTVDDEWFEGDGHDGMGTTLEEFDDYALDENDPTPEQIHAAIERAKQTSTHQPLNLKENKPKRRNYPRKKKV